ncbi:MAG: acyl-CoA thioesterase [Bacteroidia bacterium]|nr:acyl-CoA thioesterase [Bacteroidia bacterium]
METFDFELEMQVRDYECDLQGIVNNAVYQNYLEHCRHRFLHRAEIDFVQLHNDGIDAVVIRAELDYKFPLRPGDEFFVRLKMGKQGRLRVVFLQEIVRKTDGQRMVSARITTVLTKNSRPVAPGILEEKFEKIGVVMEEL